jgi:hypothetical protein
MEKNNFTFNKTIIKIDINFIIVLYDVIVFDYSMIFKFKLQY